MQFKLTATEKINNRDVYTYQASGSTKLTPLFVVLIKFGWSGEAWEAIIYESSCSIAFAEEIIEAWIENAIGEAAGYDERIKNFTLKF